VQLAQQVLLVQMEQLAQVVFRAILEQLEHKVKLEQLD
jgi:hypothetical protein